MKVTRSRLKEIIKEELRLLKESNIISEDGHTDVPSARRKMKTSVEDAMQILQGLEAMPDEGELPSWWMGKVTLAADYLNKARDYFLVSEAKEAGVPEDRRKNLLFRLTKFTRDNDLRKRVAEVVMLALSDAKELGIEEVEQVFRNKFKDPSFLTKVKGEKPIPLEEMIKEELSRLTEEDHLADDDDFNVSQFSKLTFEKDSTEDHVRDAIQMLQRSPPDAIPFVIERLYIALETLDNHPTYSDKFVDDD